MFKKLRKTHIPFIEKNGRKFKQPSLIGIMGKNENGECNFLKQLDQQVLIKRDGFEGFNYILNQEEGKLTITYGHENKVSKAVRINFDGTLTLSSQTVLLIPPLSEYRIESSPCNRSLIIYYK